MPRPHIGGPPPIPLTHPHINSESLRRRSNAQESASKEDSKREKILTRYIKHIEGLTMKCPKGTGGCGLASLTSQRGCCHNKACRKYIDANSAGSLKLSKPELAFDFCELLEESNISSR